MRSLVTMQTISAPSTGDGKHSVPQVSEEMKEYMDYMADLPNMYKQFSSKEDTPKAIKETEDPSKSLRFFEDPEDITGTSPYKPVVRRNLPKIDMKNPMTQKIVESINTLNVKEEDKDYLITLGNRESSLNPTAHQGSYTGLYQFNKNSLDTVRVSQREYKENILKQHEAALRYKQHNLSLLRDYLKYVGKTADGVKITENGLAAAAHLLGAGTVKDFFDGTTHSARAKAGFKDGLGTNILEYFKLFA
jgi:hypothetical protein